MKRIGGEAKVGSRIMGRAIARGFRIATGKELTQRRMSEADMHGTSIRGSRHVGTDGKVYMGRRYSEVVHGVQMDEAGRPIIASRKYTKSVVRGGKLVKEIEFDAMGRRVKRTIYDRKK